MLENIINTINAIFFHPSKGEEFFIHSTQYKCHYMDKILQKLLYKMDIDAA